MCVLYSVFVYGTLRQGKPNHGLIKRTENGHAKFIGLGTLIQKYPLVVASRYNIPFLLDKPGHGKFVRGEVYEVDEKMLEVLDELERHPTYYERKVCKVKLQESSEEMECWVYLLHGYKAEMLNLTLLDEYTDGYAEKYVEKAKRVDAADFYADVKERRVEDKAE